MQEAHLGGFFDFRFGRNRTINIQFLTSSGRVLPHFFLDYFHHLLERGEGESSLVSGACAVGEVVKKEGDALEAPAQEAEINFKLNLADRMKLYVNWSH